ncbi:MAG: dephospho-CoA kinase [Verrucomicrobia bacterium]|nr:dephospho-CoA kinase [Verrucomicrobiota bacterium]
MIRLGLTGGIGAGKSTAAAWFAEHGVCVIDTDVLARELVEPGQAALEEIFSDFGPAMRRPDGSLDRKALASEVFVSDSARQRLEAILHPRIRENWMRKLAALERAGESVAMVVIPLLFETQAERLFNGVIAVGCGSRLQTERLRARGWTVEEIERRVAAQWPAQSKQERADFVIWNEGSLKNLFLQCERILQSIHLPKPG